MTVVGERFDPIPRVVHQTWKTTDIPAEWQAYHASWRSQLPHWEHRLWTDDDRRRLVVERYPEFLETYDGFPREIQRVDASKYLILHAQGGVYADLDCECLKPIDPLVERGGAIVGRTRDGVIECAFFGSPPGHPLWEAVLEELRSPPAFVTALRRWSMLEPSHVLFSTGPQMLRRAVRRYGGRWGRRGAAAGLTVYDPDHFSPRSWLARDEPFPEDSTAFIHHHYADSWLTPGERSLHQYFTVRHIRRAVGVLGLAAAIALAWVWFS